MDCPKACFSHFAPSACLLHHPSGWAGAANGPKENGAGGEKFPMADLTINNATITMVGGTQGSVLPSFKRTWPRIAVGVAANAKSPNVHKHAARQPWLQGMTMAALPTSMYTRGEYCLATTGRITGLSCRGKESEDMFIHFP